MNVLVQIKQKPFVVGLIELLGVAIEAEKLDDAELILNGLRHLRPRLRELDAFEAWIAIRRFRFADAMRILNADNLQLASWPEGKALYAFCLFATGDKRWERISQELIASNQSPEATRLAQLFCQPWLPPETSANQAEDILRSWPEHREIHREVMLQGETP